MKKYIAVLTAAFAALFILCIKYPSEAFAEEECRAYVLMEAKTQTVLEEYNSNTEYNIGYLSKLMSLLLIAEDLETGKFRIDTELTVPEHIYNIQGAVVWLEPGEQITVGELLKAVIIGNANDAMLTLAAASEQTIDGFVSRMNSRAFDLGLRNTAFYSPCGLPDEREHSTAHDIAVICAQLSRYEWLEQYFGIWRDTIRGGKTDVISENRLIRTYPQHIGFKECHSRLSGYCIAEGGRNEKGETYIAVVLGAADQDTAEPKVTRLLRKGFSEYKLSSAVFPGEFLLPVKVEHGTGSAVCIRMRKGSNVVIRRDAGEITSVSVLPESISAPVRKGQIVGKAGFYSGKILVAESDIISCDDIEELKWHHVFRNSLTNMFKK